MYCERCDKLGFDKCHCQTSREESIMQIHTIEHNFEYQMESCIKQFIEDFELSPENGEDLFKELWGNEKEFGRLVINRMSEWMEEDDWLVLVQD